MHTFSKKIAAGLAVAAFALPMIAAADTTTSIGLSADVQTQIQALLAQIKTLQEQIKNLVASSTSGGMNWGMGSSTGMNPGQMGKMMCVTLNRSLHQGDEGDDVKNIQEMLKDDDSSDFSGNVTGFFGPLTAHAMMRFQMRNGIASSSDGSVGPLTRGFFQRRCGEGEGNGNGQGDNNQGNGMGGMMGKMSGDGMMNVMYVRGTISANNTSSITVNSGSNSVVVNITASTTIKVSVGTTSAPTTGTVADLIVGKNVMAGGTKNSDGSIQATGIFVGDNLSMMPMMKMDGEGESNGTMMPVGPQGMMGSTTMWMNGDDHGSGDPRGHSSMMPE
jgi:peptidoglycan hydrolase-like protein with peptidoglycan-binding domain